ncbi:MAG: FG-GAP repeat protein, partial [Gammaproteobacteria bacterium]|nr:FG-GAP repeat protein [Gammaproteobacteria bacterium]
AGDVNGDGFDDVLIGAQYADPDGKDNTGESYVVFGAAGGFQAEVELSSLDGSNGMALKGIDGGDYSGIVGGAGDVNGDGFDDLIIGAPYADPDGNADVGESYVVLVSELSAPPRPGDLNDDGCVDRTDFGVLLADVRDGPPNDPGYDLNEDGVVSIADARTLVGLFSNPKGGVCQ